MSQRGALIVVGSAALFILILCIAGLRSGRQAGHEAEETISEHSHRDIGGEPDKRMAVEESDKPGSRGEEPKYRRYARESLRLVNSLWTTPQGTNAIQAFAAIAVAFFTLALVIVTWLLIGVSSEQAQIADRQSQILLNSSRPWISARAELLTPLEIGNTVNCTIRFHLKNNGGAVATGIYVIADLIHWTNGLQAHDIVAIQQRMCARPEDDPTRPIERGVTLFPNEDTTIDRWFGYMRDHYPGIDNDSPEHPSMKPLIVGCVDYWFSFGDTAHHQTGFVFDLDWADKEGKVGGKWSIPNGSYDATKLKIYVWPYGGWYAD